MNTDRILPWTANSASLEAYRRRYGNDPVGDGEYVYRYDGAETVTTSVPAARWHPGDTFRVHDLIDDPEWTRVDEDGNPVPNDVLQKPVLPPSITSVSPEEAPIPASPPKAVASPPKAVASRPKAVASPPKAATATPKVVAVPPPASPVKAPANTNAVASP